MLILGIVLIIAAAVCIFLGLTNAAIAALLWIGIILAALGIIVALVLPRLGRSRSERL